MVVGAFLVAAASAANLNVLFIVSDDLRTDLGCYGGSAITPNVDKLASSAGAVLFDRAYVQQAICNPTRSSFLTGRRPDTTKVWDLRTQFRASGDNGANWVTLPEHFRMKGYRTYGMGKVFHPMKWKNHSDDVAGGSWSEPYFQPPGPSEDRPKGGLSGTNCGVANPENDDEKYSDGKSTRHGVNVLQNASQNFEETGQPFFIALGLHRPHLPWVTPKKYFDLYPPTDQIKLAENNKPPANYNVTGAQPWSWDPQSGPRHCGPLYNETRPVATLPEYGLVPDDVARHFRKSYWAAVSQTDRNAGVILDELEKLGRHKDTVVLFIGDHGWQLGDLGEFGKKTNFERATRTPLIIRDPTLKLAAAKSGALVEFVDIMPTLIHLALDQTYDVCPATGPQPALCSEGSSLKAIMADPVGTEDTRPAAFMQVTPFCSRFSSHSPLKPPLDHSSYSSLSLLT
jgi:arylsulfatase A-like enzyme